MGKIGICFVNPAPQIQPQYVPTLAKKCDEIGVDSLWVIDRIAYDNLEPLSVLTTAAAVTRKIRLGTSVLLAATRHPALLAKTVATLDFISGGRVTLGIGFGSRKNDFTAVGLPFEKRGTRAVEGIGLMKRLWTEENVSHKGKFYQVDNLTIGPKPIQSPHPPIWTGGSAEISLKRAGTFAEGYICGSSAIPEFPSVWEKVAKYATAAGRNPQDIERAGLGFIAINDNKAKAVGACNDYLKRYYGKVRMDVEKYWALGSPEACAERISSYFSKGLDTLILGLVTPGLNQLDLLGEKVLPLVRTAA